MNKKDKFVIYGVEFNGFPELKKHYISREPKDGVYVGCDNELYPCFDSSDYAYEDRYYCNYVFATSKESLEKKMEILKNTPAKGNYNKFTEDLAPMIYWQGDTYGIILITKYTGEPINKKSLLQRLKQSITNLFK